MPQRVVGTVKFFNPTKGYGFISLSDGSRDIFVHKNDLAYGIDNLREKQKVSFVIIDSDLAGRGEKAAEVKVEVRI